MPRVDPEKKKAILESQAFQTWWYYRKQMGDIPKDPFRAYMIDVGIPAKTFTPEMWQKRVNRGDWLPIDFPRTTSFAPKPMPKPLPQPVPQPSVLQLHRKRMQIVSEAAQQFFQKYQLPSIPIEFLHREGSFASKFRARFDYARKQLVEPRAIVGIGGSKLQALASLYHELGHYASYYRGEVEPKRFPSAQEEIFGERKAWEYASPFLTHPVQRWAKRFAMQTYLAELEKGKRKGFTLWQLLSKHGSLKEAKVHLAWLRYQEPHTPFRLAKLVKKGKPTGRYAIYRGKVYGVR